MVEKKIEDKELGLITLRRNERARRYTLKINRGAVFGIMPVNGDEREMLAFIEREREVLKNALCKCPPLFFLDESTRMQTQTFSLSVYRAGRENYYMKLNDGVLHIACPVSADFTDKRVQKILQELVGRALQHEAHRVLPLRLHELAVRHGFQYSRVKITKSKARWGSCSDRKSINLSRSLMLLPPYLSDYVLLHELCHTLEMNHSDRFWSIMDRVTDGRAKSFRQELKQYHTFD